jgi:hypothetical protein
MTLFLEMKEIMVVANLFEVLWVGSFGFELVFEVASFGIVVFESRKKGYKNDLFNNKDLEIWA